MKILFAVSAIGEIFSLFHNWFTKIPLWLLIIEALFIAALNFFGYKWSTRTSKGN